MNDYEFLADMRAKIDPAYADCQGTESWERKRALAIIDGLRTRLDWSPECPEQDGIYCRDETIRLQDAEIARLRAECHSKQARIDELMLEFCPDEVPEDQYLEWASRQRRVSEQALQTLADEAQAMGLYDAPSDEKR